MLPPHLTDSERRPQQAAHSSVADSHHRPITDVAGNDRRFSPPLHQAKSPALQPRPTETSQLSRRRRRRLSKLSAASVVAQKSSPPAGMPQPDAKPRTSSDSCFICTLCGQSFGSGVGSARAALIHVRSAHGLAKAVRGSSGLALPRQIIAARCKYCAYTIDAGTEVGEVKRALRPHRESHLRRQQACTSLSNSFWLECRVCRLMVDGLGQLDGLRGHVQEEHLVGCGAAGGAADAGVRACLGESCPRGRALAVPTRVVLQ